MNLKMENSAGCSALNLQRTAVTIGRQIRKVGKCFGAGLSRGQGVGYGVEEAVVEASSVGTIEGAASATQNEM